MEELDKKHHRTAKLVDKHINEFTIKAKHVIPEMFKQSQKEIHARIGNFVQQKHVIPANVKQHRLTQPPIPMRRRINPTVPGYNTNILANPTTLRSFKSSLPTKSSSTGKKFESHQISIVATFLFGLRSIVCMANTKMRQMQVPKILKLLGIESVHLDVIYLLLKVLCQPGISSILDAHEFYLAQTQPPEMSVKTSKSTIGNMRHMSRFVVGDSVEEVLNSPDGSIWTKLAAGGFFIMFMASNFVNIATLKNDSISLRKISGADKAVSGLIPPELLKKTKDTIGIKLVEYKNIELERRGITKNTPKAEKDKVVAEIHADYKDFVNKTKNELKEELKKEKAAVPQSRLTKTLNTIGEPLGVKLGKKPDLKISKLQLLLGFGYFVFQNIEVINHYFGNIQPSDIPEYPDASQYGGGSSSSMLKNVDADKLSKAFWKSMQTDGLQQTALLFDDITYEFIMNIAMNEEHKTTVSDIFTKIVPFALDSLDFIESVASKTKQ